MIRICRENEINLLLIPALSFDDLEREKQAEASIALIVKENPEVYALSLRSAFSRHDGYAVSFDETHLNKYGHRIIAKVIYHKIMKDKLLGMQ